MDKLGEVVSGWDSVVPLGAALAVLVAVILLLGRMLLPDIWSPYRRRESLLDTMRRELARTLIEAGANLHLCPLVQVGDLIEMRREDKSPSRRVRSLFREKVDFVLCDSRTWEPKAAIVLVNSEGQADTDKHGIFARSDGYRTPDLPAAAPPVVRLLAEAGLPVLCIPREVAIPPDTLQTAVRKVLHAASDKNRK